jgi:hypothetical protein
MHFYWFEVSMNDANGMDGLDGEDEISEVNLGIWLVKVDFLLEEGSKAASTAEIEDEEV